MQKQFAELPQSIVESGSTKDSVYSWTTGVQCSGNCRTHRYSTADFIPATDNIKKVCTGAYSARGQTNLLPALRP